MKKYLIYNKLVVYVIMQHLQKYIVKSHTIGYSFGRIIFYRFELWNVTVRSWLLFHSVLSRLLILNLRFFVIPFNLSSVHSMN